MEITYLGHSAFKLKGKQGIVVTDPYTNMVGFSMPAVTADIVTLSHDHPDHNNRLAVKPTANREKVWVIKAAGEYEVGGISVFGFESFHDDKKGADRGKNVVYTYVIDGVRIAHLGDLGHTLSDGFIERLGEIDVLLAPVGGKYTIGPDTASEVIAAIEPSYVIPMHYKTDAHDEKTFGELATLADFEKAYGVTVEPVKSLTVTTATMPEQTTLVVLQ
ncbi:MAG TPA: MBL fold metallo-hydrolase [Patescibacteria group bacterium]|nr:MBL fold metallo-hydrolase [Patescibacteria group bacterium]